MQRSLRYGSVTVFQKMAFTGRAFTRTIKALEKNLPTPFGDTFTGCVEGSFIFELERSDEFPCVVIFPALLRLG